MRQPHVDEARRRQAAAERRFRGHRIRGGLDELGDLDAPPPPKKQRSENNNTAAAASVASSSVRTTADTRFAGAAATSKSAPADAPLLSRSSTISATVFGVDWAEWMEMKRVLFDMEATVEAKRSALATMHVWHMRERKERVLPPYVAATEALLDAVLQDEVSALTDGSLRMCYGAAISRVVHIMTGSFASGNADTYRKRAREIGFPEEAVEVRQRVAHGALPLTSELRWVCGLVLQFLFTEFWLEQERQLYLMQQVDKTPVVLTGNAEATTAGVAKKSGKGERRQKVTAAGHPSPGGSRLAVPPPSVSVDEMKALLADLEDDDEGQEGKERDDRAMTTTSGEANTVSRNVVENEKVNTSRSVVTAETEGAKVNSKCIHGWLLS